MTREAARKADRKKLAKKHNLILDRIKPGTIIIERREQYLSTEASVGNGFFVWLVLDKQDLRYLPDTNIMYSYTDTSYPLENIFVYPLSNVIRGNTDVEQYGGKWELNQSFFFSSLKRKFSILDDKFKSFAK